MNTGNNRKLFYDRLSEIYRIQKIRGTLSWDQRTYMPLAGAKDRAQHLEYLALLSHSKMTDAEFGRAVDELHGALDTLSAEDQVNVKEIKRRLDISRKLPDDYLAEMSRISSMSYAAWVRARPANDFGAVQPYMEKLVELNRRYSDLVGYEEHPYDAHLEKNDPGARRSFVRPLLLSLAEELRKLMPPISEKFKDIGALSGKYDKDSQYRMCLRVAEDMGFSFETGRMDDSAHPFMTTLGTSDFRITNRYDKGDLLVGLCGAVHETGHALYEMGLPKEHAGTPMGEAASSAIHESQSRLWENVVGRSLAFCMYLHPILKQFFSEQTRNLTLEQLWMHMNRVVPSLLRTEADEVTYSQHVVVRMLIEEALLMGELKVADMPGAFDDLYEKYLGIRPPDMKDGVLQDTHWYAGSMGYFPSYAMANLYNAMMWEKANADMPDLMRQIERGEFSGLVNWLNENVASHGMRYRGPELIKQLTGRDLGVEPFVGYLKVKYL